MYRYLYSNSLGNEMAHFQEFQMGLQAGGMNPNVLSLRDLALTHYDSPQDILRRVRERTAVGGATGTGTGQSPPGSSASSMVGVRMGPARPGPGLGFEAADPSSFVMHEATRTQQQRIQAMHNENEQLRKKVCSSNFSAIDTSFAIL